VLREEREKRSMAEMLEKRARDTEEQEAWETQSRPPNKRRRLGEESEL
jgi:hypothetical protein